MVWLHVLSKLKSLIVIVVIYKKGDPSETFYIIKDGKISIETTVELEKDNKWPTVL